MITLVTITKNEEENLDTLLSVTEDTVDEIVVVDHHSDDQTRDVAESYGADIYLREWEGFGSAWNFGFEKVTGDWVLFLAADEIPSDGLLDELARIDSKGTRYDGFEVKMVNQICNRDMQRWAEYHPRVFRAGLGRVPTSKEVHQFLQVDGEMGDKLNHPVYHQTYQSVSESIQKLDRYTIEETVSAESPPGLVDLYVMPIVYLMYFLLWRRLLLDGKDGIYVSVRKGFYKFVLEYRKHLRYNGYEAESVHFFSDIPMDEIEDRADDLLQSNQEDG